MIMQIYLAFCFRIVQSLPIARKQNALFLYQPLERAFQGINTMAKKNETVDIATQEANLLAQLAAIREQKAVAETARIEGIANQVRAFPKLLGVATLAEVMAIVKSVEKGTLGKLDASASRSYTRLSDEQKAAITERLKKGEQVSNLANEFGVSGGTVYGLKQDAGLTNKRTPVAVVVAPIAAS